MSKVQNNKAIHVTVTYAINEVIYGDDYTFIEKEDYPDDTLPPIDTVTHQVFSSARSRILERIHGVPFNCTKVEGTQPARFKMVIPSRDEYTVVLLTQRLLSEVQREERLKQENRLR